MSDLQPKGVKMQLSGTPQKIMLGGGEREILFTLAAVDEIQAYYEKPVSEVIRDMGDEDKVVETAFRIIYILLNDQIARDRHFNGSDEQPITEQELKWLMTMDRLAYYVNVILTAYGISLPDEDEDESPNAESRSN